MRVWLLVLLVGCGSVSAVSGDAGGDGAPSAGDRSSHGGAAGRGGAGGELGGRGGADQVDAGDAAACISNNAPGFAFNMTCDGGSPASNGCHAACTLAGSRYVGCVDPSDSGAVMFYCYGSCADCP